MLRVQKLSRPNKRSGFRLEPGKRTEMKSILVINNSRSAVYVDKFTSPKAKKKTKKKKK